MLYEGERSGSSEGMKYFRKNMTTIAKVDLINECILRSLLTVCVLESECFAQVYLV